MNNHFMRTHRSVLHTPFLLTILAAMCIAGCASKHEAEATEKISFVVTSPLQKDTTTTREYLCQIQAIQHTELRAMERGYLEQILVDEGQHVKKGQAMFQIMPVIYQAEYQQKQAEARVVEIEYLNTKALSEKNVVSQNELAMAHAKYDQAKASMALAKAHLDFAKISAPFNGIMDRMKVRRGSLLEEGDVLAALSDNSSMWVYFNVPESQYLNYKSLEKTSGTEVVQLKLANGAIFNHTGVVTTIEADFNNETGNIAFRATFPNTEGLLRHGETGNVLMNEALKNALIIPQKATYEVLDKKYVYVVGNDNVVHSRAITVRAELPHVYVIEKGLTSGDRILLEGLRKVKEGEKITSKYVPPQTALENLHLYAE